MEKIIEKFERVLEGQKYLFLPSISTARNLVICFSSMGSKSYSRISWFAGRDDLKEIAFLFVFDELSQYYQGVNRIEVFKKIIFRTAAEANVQPERCYCVGNSMGGTAAIYYATLLQLGGGYSIKSSV